MPEQPQVAQAGGVGHRDDVGREPVEGVGGGIVGGVALAVAAVVERDDPVVAGEPVEVVGEVLLRPADAVHQEQSGGVGRTGDDGRETHAVVGRDAHRTNLRPGERRVNEPVT